MTSSYLRTSQLTQSPLCAMTGPRDVYRGRRALSNHHQRLQGPTSSLPRPDLLCSALFLSLSLSSLSFSSLSLSLFLSLLPSPLLSSPSSPLLSSPLLPLLSSPLLSSSLLSSQLACCMTITIEAPPLTTDQPRCVPRANQTTAICSSGAGDTSGVRYAPTGMLGACACRQPSPPRCTEWPSAAPPPP